MEAMECFGITPVGLLFNFAIGAVVGAVVWSLAMRGWRRFVRGRW